MYPIQILCPQEQQSSNKLHIAVLFLFFFFFIGCDENGEIKDDIKDRPIQTSFNINDFSSAVDCQNCHPNHYQEWSASMHAYAMKDPVWLSLQRQEHAVHNAIGIDLDDFCVQCHSPIASLTNAITNHENFTSVELNELPIQIQEGVTCDACHMITHFPEPMNIQKGEQLFETIDFKMYSDGTKYGTISDPQENEFHASEYHAGYDKSQLCQNCHNLSVDGIDAEVTQFEWEGSAFEAMGSECQTCHMPIYEGQAARGGPYRENLHRHFFPGIDVQLNTNSPDFELVTAIEDLLEGSAEINFFEELPDTISVSEPLSFNIIVSNNAGHNFPSGTTFTRQLWLQVIATLSGDTVFTSGLLDENKDISDFYVDPNRDVDPQLNVFNTVLYNTDGDSGLLNVGVEDMAWMSDYTLPVSGSKTVNYAFELPTGQSGDLAIATRLRFRSFPPFYLRFLGLDDEADRLPIFEIDSESTSVIVQ